MNKKIKTVIVVIAIFVSVCAVTVMLAVREKEGSTQKKSVTVSTIKEIESINYPDNTDKEGNISETDEDNDKKNHKKNGNQKVTGDDVIDVKNAFSSEKTREETTQTKRKNEKNSMSEEEKNEKETVLKKQKEETETEELWGEFY